MYKLLKLLSHLLQSEYERQAEAEKDRTLWFHQSVEEYNQHKQTRKALEYASRQADYYKAKADKNLMLAMAYRDKYNQLYNETHSSEL